MTTVSDMLYQLGGIPVDLQVPPRATAFFVHAGSGNAGNNGLTPSAALTKLDDAINLCTASRGDTIFCLPGHAENLITATAVNLNVAGVRVIGLGDGALIPTFTMTAAAGAFTVGAASVLLKNLKLLAGFATGVTQAIDIIAAGVGCTLDGIKFRDSTTNLEFLTTINVATGMTNLTIRNCSMIGLAGGSMIAGILFAGTSIDTLIEGNHFDVDSSDSVIDHSAGAGSGILIRHNSVINQDTNTAKFCIELKSDCYGTVHDNRLGYNKNDSVPIAAAGCFCFQNYVSNTIAESGLLFPTTTHAIP